MFLNYNTKIIPSTDFIIVHFNLIKQQIIHLYNGKVTTKLTYKIILFSRYFYFLMLLLSHVAYIFLFNVAVADST